MALLHALAMSFMAASVLAQEGRDLQQRADPSPSSSASTAASSAAASSSPSASPSASGSSSLPPLTTGSASSASPSASGPGSMTASLPALTGATTTYAYPPPSVPPTANAPYMQKSNLPQGSFFIIVGAVIGFFVVVIFAWRFWAMWSLRQRMNKANMAYSIAPSVAPSGSGKGGGGGNRKSSGERKTLRKSGTQFYQQGNGGSNMSLDPLNRKDKRNTDIPKGSMSAQRQSNLFFSPTAGAGAHGTAQSRASNYLPAGYYAAGGSTVVNAASTSDLSANNGFQHSMNDFQAPVRHSFAYKDSPVLRPMSGNELEPPVLPFGGNSIARSSTSSLTDGRAPSTYLDDLFDSTPVKERRSNERDQWR